MGEYTVTAPNPTYTGQIGGVAFFHGAATVTDEHTVELAYFRRKGYRIIPHEDTGSPQVERPAKADPKAAWVAYVVASTDLSDAEAADLTKAELIELAEADGGD